MSILEEKSNEAKHSKNSAVDMDQTCCTHSQIEGYSIIEKYSLMFKCKLTPINTILAVIFNRKMSSRVKVMDNLRVLLFHSIWAVTVQVSWGEKATLSFL